MKDVRTTRRDETVSMRMDGVIMNNRMVTFPEGPKIISHETEPPHSFLLATVTCWDAYIQHTDIPPSQPTSIRVILMFYTHLLLDLTSGCFREISILKIIYLLVFFPQSKKWYTWYVTLTYCTNLILYFDFLLGIKTRCYLLFSATSQNTLGILPTSLIFAIRKIEVWAANFINTLTIHLYSKTNQIHNISNLFYFGTTLYMFRTVSPSIIRSLRLYIKHQVFVQS